MNFSQLGFGSFVLRINGIFIAIIFFVSVLHYYKILQKEKLDTDFFAHNFWRWVLVGLLFGRILALLLSPEIFANFGWMSPFVFWIGGINFYGTFLGALGMMFYDLKNTEHNPLKWLDLATPSILMAILLTDLSEFITGAVYGTKTNLPWGIQYETFGVDTISPVHPVTIYSFIIHFLILLWVFKYRERFLRFPGKLISITAVIFFFAEFFLQFFRGDPTLMLGNTLRIEQIFSLLIVVGIVAYLKKRQN